MLFSKINMVDNQYKSIKMNKEESDAWSNYWRYCRFCLRMEQYQNKGLSFISEGLLFTDDTVMTCAVAEAIMNGGQKTISLTR